MTDTVTRASRPTRRARRWRSTSLNYAGPGIILRALLTVAVPELRWSFPSWDFVEHLQADGVPLDDALVRSGRRRLRPVLMTSMAAALGMLPLAYGVGSGADMLKPLAVAVIGALCISVLLSLVATPTVFALMRGGRKR